MTKFEEVFVSKNPGYYITAEGFKIEKDKLKKIGRDFYFYVDIFMNTISIDKDGYNNNKDKNIESFVDLVENKTIIFNND